MFTLRQIEVFNAVMEAGSVVGAARLLHVTQPVVSRVLRHLEDQTKVKLFERAKGRLQPTHEARFMFTEVSRIFRGVRHLTVAFEKMSAGEGRVLRVGSSPSVAGRVLPKALTRLRSRYPNLNIRLDVLSVSQISDYLIYGEGELVIGVFPQDHPSITNQRLGSGEIVLVSPAAAGGQAGRRVQGAALRSVLSENLIGFETTTPHGRLIADYLSARGMTYEPTTVVRFAESACQMVRVGLGSALVDSFTALSFQGTDLLIRRLTDAPAMAVIAHAHVDKGVSSFGRHLFNAVSSELDGAADWFGSTRTG